MIYHFLSLLILSHYFLNLLSAAEEFTRHQHNGQELLLCRKCGADVADSHYLFHKPSPGARKTEQRNVFGRQNVTVLTLVNPYGVISEVITAEKARCSNVGLPQSADSWFPNYKWTICICPQCGQHLGWRFQSHDHDPPDHGHVNQFYGIILGNILGENFTDSLIMMPKSYMM